MTPSTLHRCNSCPTGLSIEGMDYSKTPKTYIEKKLEKPFFYGKSIAKAENKAAEIELYVAIRREFKHFEMYHVREFIKGYYLTKSPLCLIDQSTVEQGMLSGMPCCISSTNTSQFISRLVHVKMLDRDATVSPDKYKVEAGKDTSPCAHWLYHSLQSGEPIIDEIYNRIMPGDKILECS